MEDMPRARFVTSSLQDADGGERRDHCHADGGRLCRCMGNRTVPVRMLWIALFAAGLVISQSGCSLFVMAGKVFFGDPKITCSFRQATSIKLEKSNQKVLILCSTPDSIKSETPALDLDLLDAIARRLKVRGVNVVEPDRVTAWLDDHGGRWDDLAELGEHFDADLIIHIDLDRFTYHEENSPTLLRGHVDGSVRVYEIVKRGGAGDAVTAAPIFDQEFISVYPEHHPVSTERQSPKTFQQEFLNRMTTQLAQVFYDHPFSEEIN